jgi:hypothetical protein
VNKKTTNDFSPELNYEIGILHVPANEVRSFFKLLILNYWAIIVKNAASSPELKYQLEI